MKIKKRGHARLSRNRAQKILFGSALLVMLVEIVTSILPGCGFGLGEVLAAFALMFVALTPSHRPVFTLAAALIVFAITLLKTYHLLAASICRAAEVDYLLLALVVASVASIESMHRRSLWQRLKSLFE